MESLKDRSSLDRQPQIFFLSPRVRATSKTMCTDGDYLDIASDKPELLYVRPAELSEATWLQGVSSDLLTMQRKRGNGILFDVKLGSIFWTTPAGKELIKKEEFMETRFTQSQLLRAGQVGDSRMITNLESVNSALQILSMKTKVSEEEIYEAVLLGMDVKKKQSEHVKNYEWEDCDDMCEEAVDFHDLEPIHLFLAPPPN